jgi:signal transduction histidine kinase
MNPAKQNALIARRKPCFEGFDSNWKRRDANSTRTDSDWRRGMNCLRFSQKRTFLRKEIELTRALAHQAMLALQLTGLSALNRESDLIAERNRVARDIHDTLWISA